MKASPQFQLPVLAIYHATIANRMTVRYDSQNRFTSAFRYMIRRSQDTSGPTPEVFRRISSKARHDVS